MSDNHIAPAQISVTLGDNEWAVVIAALYKAPMAMELTAPVTNKVQAAIAAARGMQQAMKQEGTP